MVGADALKVDDHPNAQLPAMFGLLEANQLLNVKECKISIFQNINIIFG
jgi:hypothetical protein